MKSIAGFLASYVTAAVVCHDLEHILKAQDMVRKIVFGQFKSQLLLKHAMQLCIGQKSLLDFWACYATALLRVFIPQSVQKYFVYVIHPSFILLFLGDDCSTSSDCNVHKGLCCKLHRRAKSRPKKVTNMNSLKQISRLCYGTRLEKKQARFINNNEAKKLRDNL